MARVLLVDDDKRVCSALARALSAQGHEVRMEGNGAAGLLAAHADRPDVIVLDLGMPVLDGRAMLRALRKEAMTAGIPVVVLSGSYEEATQAELLKAGANVYLVKPPSARELLSVVNRLSETGAQAEHDGQGE